MKKYGQHILGMFCLLQLSHITANETFVFNQVMQHVIDTYPGFRISQLSEQRANEQQAIVASRLGWALNSSAAIKHDLSFLGTPADTIDLQAGIERNLESGSSLSLSGSYNYTDSSLVANSSMPNPAHNTRLDLAYRMPLLSGNGNPKYIQALKAADVDKELAQANVIKLKTDIASQTQSLFYQLAASYARVQDVKAAVVRTRKLVGFVESNYKLGLAEEKDKLQVYSQLKAKESELSSLQVLLKKQRIAINRLMGRKWQNEIIPALSKIKKSNESLELLQLQAERYSPALRIASANLTLAEAKIETARDEKQSSLDLVLSVGTRTSSGDNTTGSVSEEDLAGTVRLEYKKLLDERGLNSGFRQAELDRHIALENIQIEKDNIHYQISSLYAEIDAAEQSVSYAKKRLHSEQKKLNEARDRYKNGRADIGQVIQFENDFSFAQLSYQQQKIELESKKLSLNLVTGKFWEKFNTNGVTK